VFNTGSHKIVDSLVDLFILVFYLLLPNRLYIEIKLSGNKIRFALLRNHVASEEFLQ